MKTFAGFSITRLTSVLIAIVAPIFLFLIGGCSRSETEAMGLKINEAMARNQNFDFVDDNGEHLDWVEIYNPHEVPVPLAGYSLTDNFKRPLKFRFAPNDVIEPHGFYIVYVISQSDLDKLAVEAAERGEEPSFKLSSRHAVFGISPVLEDLFLFAGDGALTIDRIQINQLATDLSVGRFPDGGESFGTNYSPSPSAANVEAGVIPVRWLQRPRVEAPLGEDCRDIPLTLILEQDDHASALPQVTVEVLELPDGCDLSLSDRGEEIAVGPPMIAEYLEINDCDPALGGRIPDDPAAAAAFDPSDPSTIDPDDGCRRDASGAVIHATLRSLTYEVFLPQKPCLSTVIIRVTVDDGIRELIAQPRCYTYGAVDPTLVVSEYQPRNKQSLYFICENCDDSDTCFSDCNDCPPGDTDCIDDCMTCEDFGVELGSRVVHTPDWIEIFNYGEEEINLSFYGLRGRIEESDSIGLPGDGEDEFFTWQFGPSTDFDPRMTSIGPGEYRLILAAGDGGEFRKIYRQLVPDDQGRLIPDMTRKYYSTSFKLDPDKPTIDEFLLQADSGVVIDEVVLDFRAYAEENGLDISDDLFLADRGIGRFPELNDSIPDDAEGMDRYPPNALVPGIVTQCATPEEANRISCDVAPSFDLFVSVFPRSPAENQPVRVRARLSVDEDSREDFQVRLRYFVEGAPNLGGILERGAGLELALSSNQSGVEAGAVAYDIEAQIPGLSAGSIVDFSLDAIVLMPADQGDVEWTAVLDEQLARESGEETISFTYRVDDGQARELRINEIMPRNVTTILPGFSRLVSNDYLELYLPESASVESIDLSGQFLTFEGGPEDEGFTILRPREIPFPSGTILRRGEFLLVAFGELPEVPRGVIQVRGMELDDCNGVAYLIGPDEDGNPVVGSLGWWDALEGNISCNIDESGDSTADDTAIGPLCDGADSVSVLTAASPSDANSLAPLLVGVSHRPLLGGEPNACGSPGSFVLVQVEFLIDRALEDLPLAEVYIELDDGTRIHASNPRPGALPDSYPELHDVPVGCLSADLEASCYLPFGFVETLRLPTDRPMVRFRVVAVDACGGELNPCGGDDYCFSIGTSSQSESPIVINEINRLSSLPGDTEEMRRHWIELYNPSSGPIDASGFSVSYDPNIPRMAVLPAGTVIESLQALLVVTDGAPLEGEDLPSHIVLRVPWAQYIFDGGSRRCRERGAVYLFGDVEQGSCLVDVFNFDFSEHSGNNDHGCGSTGNCGPCRGLDGGFVSLGRLPDGSDDIVRLPAPSPGELNDSDPPGVFLRCDAGGDGFLDISDAVNALRFLFSGQGQHSCPDALDCDDSGMLNVTDPVYLLQYLFNSGDAPKLPFPEVGVDPTEDDLSCSRGSQ